jgi:hypothetical protein
MDCRATVADSCACTLTNNESFAIADGDTIAVTKPFDVSVFIANAWCHTVFVA